MTLLWILLAAPLSGLIALGIAYLLLKAKLWTHDRSHLFLCFAAGALLTVALTDLLPEAVEAFEHAGIAHGIDTAMLWVLVGFVIFFSIEKLILWYHCHEENCEVHRSASMIIIGDTMHNFLDGIAIATAFLVSVPVGIATTVAVFFHEIPQEVADFSVLFTRMKTRAAIFVNSISALASLVGALIAYFFATKIEGALPALLAITAGGFIYIPAADLIPEIHKEMRRPHMVRQFLIFPVGCASILLVARLFAH